MNPPNWTVIEVSLKSLPRPALARFLARAAARVVPLVAKAEAGFGSEAIEWMNALAAAVRVVEAVAEGKEVSEFTLTIAAELARAVPVARVNLSRKTGFHAGSAVEELEHVSAAVAYAVDALRAISPERAIRAAVQTSANADAACFEVGKLLEFDAKMLAAGMADDLGELWPAGEPEWFAVGNERLRSAVGLPRVLDLGERHS